jgi:CheY-like chemotaxis protein
MSAKIRVLLIDDDAALTRSLKLNLEDSSRYEVGVINHPGHVIEAALRNPPDVVVLDIMMPALDGVAVANAMLDTPALAHVPVIFLTALVRKSEENALRKHMPVRRYLGKPVTVQELEAAIREAIAARPPEG